MKPFFSGVISVASYRDLNSAERKVSEEQQNLFKNVIYADRRSVRGPRMPFFRDFIAFLSSG
jgi:hypothetical protein